MTFEVTYPDNGPLFDEYREAALLLGNARKIYDKNRPQVDRLKFNSKRIRAGDWLVWAENEPTKEWLTIFFTSPDFIEFYKATLMSDRGQMVKYKVKVPAPDSTTDFDLLLAHLFDELGCFGYVRFTNETRWYKDPKVNEKYNTAIKKKKVSQFKDDDAEYDKFIWIKMSTDASRFLDDNLDKLNYHYGVTKMILEKVPDRGEKRDNQGQVLAIQGGSGGNVEPLGLRAITGPQRPENENMNGQNEVRNDNTNRNTDEASDYDELMELEAANAAERRVDQVPPVRGAENSVRE